MSIVRIDYTHVGRRTSGIERVTTEQFSGAALSPLPIRPFGAFGSRLHVMAAQTVGLPACAIRNPSDIFIFPGFPPCPYFAFARDRAVLYVHDLFLLTRRADLNRAAKYYMAPMFSIAVRKLRYFLTNSQETARQLRSRCDPAATVIPYRPSIRNVFGLALGDRAERASRPDKLRVVSIGTVEPRKNLIAAADICEALSARLQRPVEHHIIGRLGWGADANLLRKRSSVILHGALDDAQIRPIVEAADILLCTSHQEGLGLPLLEAQYSGIPIVARDAAVFREVVGSSGLFIDTSSPQRAAEQIAHAISDTAWRSKYAAASTSNVARWNKIAESDRVAVVTFLSRLCRTREVRSKWA
jgi:glycosyltransferase involved in cell wall biosynthesis